MKKVTTYYDKQLQKVLLDDDEFRRQPLISNAHLLIKHVVELVMLQRHPTLCVPVVSESKDGFISLYPGLETVLKEVHQKTLWVQVKLFSAIADACIRVQIRFYGPKRTPLVDFFGGVDSAGVRKLDITIFDSLRSAKHFSKEMRRFDFIALP